MLTRFRKALVVDDDVAIRVLVSRVLTRADFHVDVARDGAEAMEKITAGEYDVIVLDLMMPRIDGIAVVKYLDEHEPSKLAKVIVLTAFGASAVPNVCPPVVHFLHKPFDIDQLVREVEACIGAGGAASGESL